MSQNPNGSSAVAGPSADESVARVERLPTLTLSIARYALLSLAWHETSHLVLRGTTGRVLEEVLP